MESGIRALCAISILCGLLFRLTPEGSVRKSMAFVCSVVLLACVLSSVKNLELDDYALRLSLTREREQEFLLHADEARNALDRLVIEREYGSYIMDTAELLGIPLQSAEVLAEWSLEGLWVPRSVILYGSPEEEGKRILSDRIQADLGIPTERQEWIGDG